MGALIDTSVLVAVERGALSRSDLIGRAGDEAALSVVTASELLHGVHRADSARKRVRRERFVEAILAELRVLPVDLDVARTHAQIWADLRARRVSVGAHDLLIAATALVHGLAVATRNVREFRQVEGLSVEVW